jgi:hypothetical protein
MQISHIGHSILRTPHDSLQLKDVLHVPVASKNLLSVHKLTLDNNAFMEFHPWFFFIKDREFGTQGKFWLRGPAQVAYIRLLQHPLSHPSKRSSQ